MSRGGARQGAGRPKGLRNKRTVEMQAAIAAAGETPLDYMLRVMRDPQAEQQRRDAMAKAVAPYVHPQLASIKHDGNLTVKRADALSDDELAGIAATSGNGVAAPQVDPTKLN